MKTGKDVLDRALRLLGYTDSEGELDGVRDAAIFKRGEAAVKQIYDDLKRIDRLGDATLSMEQMTDRILLSKTTIHDVMPYGVAMLLAQSEGDGDEQALFATLYSRKRSGVSRAALRRGDTLPGGGYG